MIRIPHVLSSRWWLPIVFCILIGAIACQQEKPPPQGKVAQQQEQFQETSPKHQPINKEDSTMAFYLTRFSYTPETWARLMKNPEDRRVAARKYIESVGGKLHGFWYSFGAYDGYCLWEAPDNVSMAAVGIAITGGGAVVEIRDNAAAHGRRDPRRPSAVRRRSPTGHPESSQAATSYFIPAAIVLRSVQNVGHCA